MGHVRPERVLLWVTAVAVPLFGFLGLFLEPSRDPAFPARLGLAATALLLLWGSTRYPRFEPWLPPASWVLACALYLFFGARAVHAGFTPGHMVALMLICTLTVSTLPTPAKITTYLGFVLFTGWLGYRVVQNPGMPPALFYSSMICLILGVGWVTVSRVSLEKALLHSQLELEQRVLDRTAALNLEIEIRTAAELSAVSSNRAKTRFLANMSHELRTPLNAILGYGELLREDLVGEARIEDVDRVLESARHLERMISDLLDLSRIEAGALEVTLESVSVRAVMVEVVRLLGPERERAGTEIRLDIADVQVRTDRLRLGQIALNLLTNALKFAPGGLIQLRAAPEGERWALEVEDDGVGIEAHDLERIFDRFAQVDESSTRTTRGAGLGLALCRDLAHRLGGELTVRSKKGEGSTFRLTLPKT